MQKNRRTITVDGNKYVWWYRKDAGLCDVTVQNTGKSVYHYSFAF